MKKAVIFLNILIPFLLGCMVDLYAPALPTIAVSFQAKLHLVQLSISLYLLGYGIGQIFLGILSDNFGRRKTLLFSTILFIGVSILAASSKNMNMLNLCRFLQGVSIAGLCLSCRATAVDCFSGLQLTRVMSYFYISRSIGIIVAPFIGGYLLHYFNWQADFYFFALFGIIIFVYISSLTTETKPTSQNFTTNKLVKTLSDILSAKTFVYFAIILTLIYSSWMAFEVIGPFLIQNVLKYSMVNYGYMLAAAGIVYFIGNLLNHVLINYFKPLLISFVAIICFLLTSITMLALALLLPINLYIILLPLLLISFLTGFVFPNLTAAALGMFKTSAGTAGAILGAFMSIGVFLISTFASLFKTSSQMPMAIIFVVLSGICVLMFAGWQKEKCS
jgi:Bcr/CflA subfamily drug resistance transporter